MELSERWQDCDDDEIAAAWIAYRLAETTRGAAGAPAPLSLAPLDDVDEQGWAIDALRDLQFDDPLRALEIAFEIARSSEDAWVLGCLGAGPIEALLSDDPTLFDAIALESRSNPNLVTSLKSVWRCAMPDHTWAAVRRLAGS